MFSLEPHHREFTRGAMYGTAGDRRIPFVELDLEVHHIDNRPSGEEVPLHILDAQFDLALGLGPVGPTYTRLKPPIVDKGFEGGIPDAPPGRIRIAHRARAVIEMFPGVAAEVAKERSCASRNCARRSSAQA
ncbi:MAG: hypothetical protein ABI856_11175 [Nitrospira sp.]